MSPASPSPAEDGGPEHPPFAAAEAPLWSPTFVQLLVAQALFGFAYATFLLLPKLLAVGYGAKARDIGFVMASFGVVSLVSIPMVAPVVSRLGRRRALVLANLLLGASATAFVTIDHAGFAAALLRGLQGVAWSLFFASGNALVADAAPPARLGQAIGLFGGASLAMNAIAPAVAEPIAAALGPRPVFVLAGVVALAGAWYCRRLPVGIAAAGSAVPANDFGQVARARAPVFSVLAAGALAAAAMFTFVAPFALSYGIPAVRDFFIAYTCAALGVRLTGARVTDRAGHRLTALAGGCAYGVVVALMGALGPGRLAVVGAAFGVAHGIVFPALMALILGGVSSDARPRLLALANGAMNLGIIGLGPLGAAAERLGYPPVFVATGALTFASALLLLLPQRMPPRRSAASGPST